MKTTNHLTTNKNNIIDYNDVKKIIDDLKNHRDNFDKIGEYCRKNLKEIEKRQLELMSILKDDKTYCILYHFLNNGLLEKETVTPFVIDENYITECYNISSDKKRELEQQAIEAIEQEKLTAAKYEKIIPDNLLKKLQKQGFIENSQERPLKWQKTKSLLAYFADVANDKLNLKHGEKRQIRPFENLFSMSGLTYAINGYNEDRRLAYCL